MRAAILCTLLALPTIAVADDAAVFAAILDYANSTGAARATPSAPRPEPSLARESKSTGGAARIAAGKAAPPVYPSRSQSGRIWLHNGSAPSVEHLAATHGFDRAWLRTLNQSQLTALHGDAHEGRLQREAKAAYCPNCVRPSTPVYGRRLLRWGR